MLASLVKYLINYQKEFRQLKKFNQLNLNEFIEAIARVAERISPMPPYYYNKNLDTEERIL